MENKPKDPILNLLPALRRQHPLRRQAEAILLNPEAPVEDLQPVLHALTDSFRLRRKEQLVASWLIAHANWTDDQRIHLSEKLSIKVEKEVKGRRTSRSLFRWFLRSMIVSTEVCFALLVFYPHLYKFYYIRNGFIEGAINCLSFSIPLTLVCSVASLPVSLWIDDRTLTQLVASIGALGDLGQPACIASLAKATAHGPLRHAAVSALKRVTSTLRSDDLGALPGQTVPALCSALVTTSPETALVILEALTVIGDGRAISKVESLARNASDPDVREAAANLLPILQQRVLDSEASSLLLRASNAPPDSGQTLLRPVREQSYSDPSQLLRMATFQDKNERP